MHIAHLARAENELLASPLEDELRFIHREDVRGAVVLLRQLLLRLHHFAGEANDHVVFKGLSVNGDGSERRAFDLHSLTLVLFPILRDTLNGMRAIALTAPAPFVDQREGSPVASVAVFFFASGRSARKLGSVTSSHAPERRLNARFMSKRHPLHL